MAKWIMIVVVILGGLGATIFAFSSQEEGPEETTSISGSWQMVKYADKTGGSSTDLQKKNFHIEITEDSISGAICNSFAGNFEIINQVMRTDGIRSTKMACRGETGDIENAFFMSLQNGLTIKIEGNVLNLGTSQAEFSLIKK